MRRVVAFIAKLLVFLFVAYLVLVNVKLYQVPVYIDFDGVELNEDVLAQLTFLEEALHERGAGKNMQKLYPEGFVFINALYGLTWSEVARVLPTQHELRRKAIEEMNWSIAALKSADARSRFSQDLDPPLGAFYNGWTNYLQVKRAKLFGESNLELWQRNELHAQTRKLIQAYELADTPYLESYWGASWPADNVVAMASIAIYNKLFPDSTTTVLIKTWLGQVQEREDSLSMIPHSCDARTGYPRQMARGNSMGLMLSFLPEIDQRYAQEQKSLYETHFFTSRAGLTGVREHAPGQGSGSDIDSGPVLLGVGGAASLVGLRHTSSVELRKAIDAFGLSFTSQGKKRYLFGLLPMADAFIAWGNSAHLVQRNNSANDEAHEFYWKFHLVSAVLLAIAVFAWRKVNRLLTAK